MLDHAEGSDPESLSESGISAKITPFRVDGTQMETTTLSALAAAANAVSGSTLIFKAKTLVVRDIGFVSFPFGYGSRVIAFKAWKKYLSQ